MPTQNVPNMTPVPPFPALSERAAGTYNTSAYAFGNHMAVKFNGELLAVANNVESNALEAASGASVSLGAAASANIFAAQAVAAAVSAEGYAAQAETYAQAAGGGAGIPTPVANKYLGTDGGGNPAWVNVPSDAAKLDKTGGVATAISYPYLDHGSTTGSKAVSATAATVHRVQATGAVTLSFTDLPAGSVSTDLEIHCVNFGGKTITWPTGNWIKSDGSYAAAVANSGVTWQTTGTDRVLVMIDNGQVCYKVLR